MDLVLLGSAIGLHDFPAGGAQKYDHGLSMGLPQQRFTRSPRCKQKERTSTRASWFHAGQPLFLDFKGLQNCADPLSVNSKDKACLARMSLRAGLIFSFRYLRELRVKRC